MSRAIWKGDVSFGLVTVPVEVHPAETSREIAFHMLDRRDLAPVKQHRVNAVTGEEVPWEEVVKGFEYEPGRYVVVTDDDLRAANVEATRTIDIIAMVRAEEIPLPYYDRPYYLTPATPAACGTALMPTSAHWRASSLIVWMRVSSSLVRRANSRRNSPFSRTPSPSSSFQPAFSSKAMAAAGS